MSETQSEQTTNQSPTVVTPTVTTPPTTSGFLSNWKVKAGIIGTVLAIFAIGIFTLDFFWVHIISSMGLKDWSKHANVQPIECMMRDTDNNGYVSCSAKERDGKMIALECGSNIFNIGCRVKVKMEP